MTPTLAHVEDGGLPEHVERARTHVSVERDAPKNTATAEYAGAYFAHGLDNSFDLERFRRQLTINLQHLDDEEVVFDIIGIDAAIANALRRILIAEVPTMAIEKVFVLQNTTMTEDEVLAHRLGLIPIRADPRLFRDHSADDDVDEHNVVAFRLAVKCEHKPGAGDGPPGSRTADLVNGQVLSSALQWIPQGDQETRFADRPIRPVHDDILITKMRPGQEIMLEAWCERGIGKTHAKWSPVSTASYRLMPKVEITAGLTADEARALHAKCPMGVFDIEDVGGVATAKVARPRNCSMCRECIREPGWEDKVKLLRQRNHFIFSIESTGVLPPDELFREATKVLLTKASELGALLKDTLVAQREDVGSGAL